MPATPVPGLERFELSSSTTETPWFAIPPERRLGLFVAGSGVGGGPIELQWGRRNGAEVDVLRSDVVGDVQPRIPTSPWTFLAASELPAPHPLGGSRSEITRHPATVSPRFRSLPTPPASRFRSSRVVGAQDSTLVHPNLLLYLPCARQPLLANGVVEVPRYFVWFDDAFQPHPYEDTSPFLGIEDLYPSNGCL